ncbi:hypothetical protein [Sediminibacterium goheungense]|uniref:YjcQ protein n=1 Tax=Sediminibacterium goheungense TaxID=1086393 RepID=A0A4V3C585_9BACT|nr:hypothetical protein [Sediminibacterium goheungense]TDO28888.1 hypothetical protein BC659_0970 [Sediminibacterium goheungense]
MDNTYQTLQTLYRIVREETHPEQYLCTPREMVLHSTFGWDLIHKHLISLAEEGLVILQQLDTPHCYITPEGIELVRSAIPEETEKAGVGLVLNEKLV